MRPSLSATTPSKQKSGDQHRRDAVDDLGGRKVPRRVCSSAAISPKRPGVDDAATFRSIALCVLGPT